MIDKDLFIKIILPFWSHIFNKTRVPIREKVDKSSFLEVLVGQINDFTYSPKSPREYVVSNKHNLVTRIVPILSLSDICVYYFCQKNLESNLAVNRVTGTYGGFSSGGCLRKKEDEDFASLAEIPFSISPYPFNPLAWIEAWRDFQKKAYMYSLQSGYSCFVQFDIANFYDCINLNLLEKKIRGACGNNLTEVVDLLFLLFKKLE